MEMLKYFAFGIVTGLMFLVAYFFYVQQDSFKYSNNVATVGASYNERQVGSNGIDFSRNNAITNAVKHVSPSIVGINVISIKKRLKKTPFSNDPIFKDFFPKRYEKMKVQNSGSGFIFSDDGYILTNEHVIHNAIKVLVTTTEGKDYEAEIVARDYVSDIAILKIDVENYPYVDLGDSDDILVGEWVIAFGNPYGFFQYNDKPLITVGVVSGIDINIGQEENRFYEKMVQTDAAINPGNSGGPLVNSLGEVIGMNTMIISKSDAGSVIGFASPINKVKEIKDILIRDGVVNRNIDWSFRIFASDVDDSIAKEFNLVRKDGVIIYETVIGGPADMAGLKKGDLIVGVDNIRINNFNDMKKAIFEGRDYKVGDIVKFRIFRGKIYMTQEMELKSIE